MVTRQFRTQCSQQPMKWRKRPHFTRTLLSASIVLALSSQTALAEPSRGVFPRACGSGACTASGGPGQWITYGSVSSPYRVGNTMTIEQTSQKATLNWQSFDVGADNTVHFEQPNSTSVALNRVWDQTNPSQIFGHLTATGQIYLYNRNGILFGPNASVDVNTLVATSLDISDQVFEKGLNTAINEAGEAAAAFKGNGHGVVVDATGSPVLFAIGADGKPGRFRVDEQNIPVRDESGALIADAAGRLVADPDGVPLDVVIDVAAGADLRVQNYGSLMLLGANVANAGTLTTPDGQAILAAGNKVYLQSDQELRGFLVEVDVDAVSNDQLSTALTGGTPLSMGNVTNTGTVSAPRGNVTLAGLAINQQGRISATSAVTANGSIRLLARDKAIAEGANMIVLDADGTNMARTGSVVFGAASHTTIALDTEKAAATAVDEQDNLPSTVTVMGRTITLLSGSEIVVPSGEVNLTALANPKSSNSTAQLVQEDGVDIRIEAGSRIDVSGVTTQLAMERNVIEVELRGNELADSPLQRDGILAGQKVNIDIRTVDDNDRIPIANLTNAMAGIQRTVAERSTAGGTVTIASTGKADFQSGAEIDVSGGAVHYRDGYIATSKLLADGQTYDIADADPNRQYDGILYRQISKSDKWGTEQTWHIFGGNDARGRFEEGYIDGKDAGTVSFTAYDPSLQGNLLGGRSIGRNQRESGQLPLGGELIIGDPGVLGIAGIKGENYMTPDVMIAQQGFINSLREQALLPDNTLTLSTDFIQQGGFTRSRINSNGTVSLVKDTPLSMAPGGELRINAAQVDIKSDIDAPSGVISLNAVAIDSDAQNATSEQALINIADDVTLSTRGTWSNDASAAIVHGGSAADLSTPALPDGGRIEIALNNNGELHIGDRVNLDVSGGAWLQADGKLKAGKGGELEVGTTPGSNRDYVIRVGEDLDLRGDALQQGGSLTLRLPSLVIEGEAVQGQAGFAAQRNDLGGLSSVQRAALAQQVLDQWVAEQAGTGVASTDPQLLAVLQQVAPMLVDDGSQTPEQQQTLVQTAIDQARLALSVSPQLFRQGGFSQVNLEATLGDLVIKEGTVIQPKAQNRVLNTGFRSQPSGADIAKFSHLELLPDAVRQPTNLTLSVSSEPTATGPLPTFSMETGAVIETDAQAQIALSSSGLLDVNGRISAPAGSIDLSVDSDGNDYHADRIIHLGEQAELSVAGTTLLQPNEAGLRQGEVLAGGQVTLTALGGGIDMDVGASIDVSGSAATLDLPANDQPIRAQRIASAAGAITALATEGMRLDGALLGHADRDAGAAGGALSVTLNPKKVSGATSNRGARGFPEPIDPQTGKVRSWAIRLSQAADAAASGDLSTGEATLNVDGLTDGGFDALTLNAPMIQFDGDVDLHLDRSIVLDAPQFVVQPVTGEVSAAQVILDAPYVALGASYATITNDKLLAKGLQATAGSGQFVVGDGNTHLIDLIGKTALQGVSTTALNSLGDIRLRSALDEYNSVAKDYLPSGFNTAGTLTLTASQVYPTTLSRFTLASADVSDDAAVVPGRIVIEPGVAEPSPVLSVAGKITLDASIIENKGVLKAPLGEIQLGADDAGKTQSVVLAPGSVTSTAANVEQVPFGTIQAGSIWKYDGQSTITVYNEGIRQYPNKPTATTQTFDAVPEQRITLRAQNVDIQDGATVDAHGGGDAVAYEFLPGPDGSRDVLVTANAIADGRYVILPWLKDGYAPYDAQAFKAWELDAGASVEILKDSNGLEAGVYPLLPASYALLPGAYLVTMENGYRDLNTSHSTRLLDGTAAVPARMTVANTALHDSRTLGLTVRKGDYANTLAKYDKTTLSQFLPEHGALDEVAIPRLPQDAGTLVIDATSSIALNGNMISDAAAGGRGAQVDIVADQLEIVTQLDAAATAVQLDAADLSAFGAQSILIGGTRSSEADGVRINVGAERVTVKSGVELEVPELILAAGVEDANAPEASTAGVHVETDVILKGAGDYSGQASNLYIGKEDVLDKDDNVTAPGASGGGALLRVSSANQVSVRRANSGNGTGALTIAEGATIGADESMVLDATGASQIDGTLDISGGSLNLGAEKVSLGDVPANTQGLTISNTDLSKWALRELVLTSRGNVDFYGDVNFGTDVGGNTLLQSLAFETPGLVNHGGDTTLTAGSIRLTAPETNGDQVAITAAGVTNGSNTANTNPTGASGSLTISTNVTLTIGEPPVPAVAPPQIVAIAEGGRTPLVSTPIELLVVEGSSLSLNALVMTEGGSEQLSEIDGTGELLFGAGDFAIGGYTQAKFNAERRISSEGEGLVNVAADVTLDAPLLTTGDGARTTLDAGDHAVTIARSAGSTEAGNLGGTLVIKGGVIEHNGNIRVRSGQVALQAQAAGGDVTLKADSVIDVSGISKQFDEVTVDTWGGKVTLDADDGNVIAQNGSVINVTGADAGNGADAGSISVKALGEGNHGTVTLDGTLQGSAQAGFNQGSFDVDARELTSSVSGTSGFTELNQVLNAGGFTERRAVRLRSGDMVVEAGEENGVSARNVVLTADDSANGNITVNGNVGLAADKSGSINLNAQGNVVLADGAVLTATALGDGERGGSVLLASEQGSVTVNSGSQIDVSAGAEGRQGSVRLRAARRDSNSDGLDDSVAIAPIAGTITGAGQVVAEAVKVNAFTTDLIIDAVQQAAWKTATQDFMDLHGADIAAALDPGGILGLTVSPGLEIRSTGSITLADEWDLASWRYGTTPGVLTLRAQDDVQLDKNLTDGFRANALQGDDSWSYRIVGGANNQSADVLATVPVEQLTGNSGNVILAANTKLRTGNGAIDVMAGKNVELQDTSAVIYTAGVPALKDGVAVPSGTVTKKTGKIINWAEDGGDVTITAGADLIGQISYQSPNSWLWRQGGEYGFGFRKGYVDTRWAVDYTGFQQGVAAFGGGDIRLSAGGNLESFSAAIPTTGRQSSPGADRSMIDIWGGGNLSVKAGGDIKGGVYLVGRGEGLIQAGGALTTAGNTSKINGKKLIYPLLAVGEGGFHLQTGGDLLLETVIQPTMIPRPNDGSALHNNNSEFLIYDPSAFVEMISLGGDVAMQSNNGQIFDDTKSPSVAIHNNSFLILPPSLKTVALNGSVDVSNGAILLPSSQSSLWLLAENNVDTGTTGVLMSDYDPALLPSPSTPISNLTDFFAAINTHAAEPLHQNDNEPVYVVANSGDIKGRFTLPKQAHLVAGRDINRVGLTVQNVNPDDVTLVQAGRDIRYTQSVALSAEHIQVDGPGRLDVIAGRNLNLGASDGITTRGNQSNSALPDGGADVNVLVGVANGLDYDAFIQKYLVDSDTYRNDLTAYMRTRLDQPDLSDADAMMAFLNASRLEQRPLIMQTLYAELNAAGIAASDGTGSYESGYTAIETLFDSDRGYDGDLSMYLSRIYTQDGGDINLAVPGGLVNAGLAISTSELGINKGPDQLGIVAQRQGSVSAMVDEDFIVNQSRVFTLGGGDLMLWSSHGNIDAGRGAKSAISAPEPIYTFDSNGNLVADFGGAIAGSGIRVVSTIPGVEAGTTYLWAPEGKIDAGDAGIEAGSNLFLGAQQVVGADNIKVSGSSFGTPIASSNLDAGLSGDSSLASNAGKSAEENLASATEKDAGDSPLADAALSFLEVEVLGFGNGILPTTETQDTSGEPSEKDDKEDDKSE
ncbi:MAG: filamentous hemagglutinin family protein [Gammaproteobacteria bacterium]|nr:filamentous hemagglutinin family protein [Gammaproteobacteria bacterium]